MATNNPEPENVALTFGYNGERPNFRRDQFDTLYRMSKVVDNIDEGHVSFCLEDKKMYQFLGSNPIDETTGRWRVFVDPSEIEAHKAKIQTLESTVQELKTQVAQSGSSSAREDQITFLNSIQEYDALPEATKKKANHLFVINRTAEA